MTRSSITQEPNHLEGFTASIFINVVVGGGGMQHTATDS